MIKKIIFGLFILLAAAQFVRPVKNQSSGVSPTDITLKHPVPPEVKAVLEHACYDCHSNRTHYPWYAEVQPVAWWLDSHIKDGKRHLNFSEFDAYDSKRAAKKLRQISDEMEQHDMPLKSYTWMHPEARLTPAQITKVADWVENLAQEMEPAK